MFAPATVLIRKIENDMSGCVARVSRITKPTSMTTAAAKTPIVLVELQPQSFACVIPNTAVERPPVTSTAPRASKPCVRMSRLSPSSTGASASAVIPTGMLRKKIHSQLRRSVKTPPSSTPAAAPNPPTAPQTPSAMLRSLPSEKVVIRIDRAAGAMIAAPRPWMARAPISDGSFHASAARSDAPVNTTRP